MGRSHTLRVYRLQLIAHFGLAFVRLGVLDINLAAVRVTRRIIMQKARRQPLSEQAPH